MEPRRLDAVDAAARSRRWRLARTAPPRRFGHVDITNEHTCAPQVDNIKKNVEAAYDPVQLMKIQAHHFQKPVIPDTFGTGLVDMGEHAMSFQERLGEYKAFYENLQVTSGLPGASPTNPVPPPPFYNLTIGGVYRDTPDRTEFKNVSRGYVTHATPKDKELVADIFQRLGVDVQPRQVAISAVTLQSIAPALIVALQAGQGRHVADVRVYDRRRRGTRRSTRLWKCGRASRASAPCSRRRVRPRRRPAPTSPSSYFC